MYCSVHFCSINSIQFYSKRKQNFQLDGGPMQCAWGPLFRQMTFGGFLRKQLLLGNLEKDIDHFLFSVRSVGRQIPHPHKQLCTFNGITGRHLYCRLKPLKRIKKSPSPCYDNAYSPHYRDIVIVGEYSEELLVWYQLMVNTVDIGLHVHLLSYCFQPFCEYMRYFLTFS